MSFVAQRVFTENDQGLFAHASGDRNPIHTDALAARRLLFGEPVVHGVHALLWMLNAVASRLPQKEPSTWLSVATRFRKPVFLNEMVSISETVRDASVVQYVLRRDEVVLISVRISVVDAPDNADQRGDDCTDVAVFDAEPNAPTFDQARHCAGRISSNDESGLALLDLFPALGKVLGTTRLTQIALLSAIVGMRVPGKHSLIAALSLTLASNEKVQETASVAYAVDNVSEQFNVVHIAVRASGMRARLEAFFRPAPVELPAMEELRARTDSETFAGHRVLVVGGSRGLGGLAACILSAGGAEVIVTYANGVTEAEALGEHPRIRAVHLDVVAATDEDFDRCFSAPVDVLIYCATPRIFFRRSRSLHPDRLHKFMEYYVSGFSRLFAHFINQAPQCAACLYPSSVAVERDDADTVEYRIAKLAGEQLCKALAAQYPECRLSAPRLPRLNTDQTAMIGAQPSEDSVPYMINLLTDLLDVASREVPGTERA